MVDTDLIKPMIFNTSDLPREHQFEAWRAYHSSVIDGSSSRHTRHRFDFEQHIWNLGKLVFTAARMPGPLVPRTWRHLRRDPLDHWCLVLPESGFQSAHVADSLPRQVHFRSLGRPFEGAAADSSVSTIFIPRDLFRNIAGPLDGHSGTLNSDGLGGLLADFLIALGHRLPTMTANEVPNLVEAIRTMVAACLIPTADRIAEAREPIDLTILERARLIILRDIYSPALSPANLCLQLGVSRSKLYSLFEPLGGVGRYIRRHRLLAAHQMLSDPSNMRSIGDLAKSLCFSDAATFSRSFRNEIGCSPSDVRAAADRIEWMPSPNLPLYRTSVPLTDLGGVLRHLQI
ncbi:helix-turn-helix domain-containing protein [Paraburkholderia aspalathi]|nr:helix-turn-helix domain-containing protein [Paraburkholderia aspalathi]